MSKVINEQGNHYGMITVNERGPNDNNGKAQWFCTCECGNTFLARGTDLRRNKILTCGCTSYNKGQALVGQKFGKLTVIKFLGTNNYGKHEYECLCDCGNTTIVVGQHLKNGNTKSCGCIKQEKSVGEQQIEKILKDNNIKYCCQKKFPDLIYKSYLSYDFAILNENNNVSRLIEFDGEQHFDKTNNWHSASGEIRDKIKNYYAKENNIPLIRIPYYMKEKITIEDLLSDKWLVVMDMEELDKTQG